MLPKPVTFSLKVTTRSIGESLVGDACEGAVTTAVGTAACTTVTIVVETEKKKKRPTRSAVALVVVVG